MTDSIPVEQELLPYQLRVIEEKHELVDRLEKLRKFIAVPAVSTTSDQLNDLIEQKCAMQLYLNTLNRRIAKF